MATIPASLIAGPDYAPAVGSVHGLGHGNAFGWIHDGRICWSAGTRSLGTSGCVSPNLTGAEVVIREPDTPGSGKPVEVFGLAADGVTTVSVTLANGQSYVANVQRNWYDVTLPVDANPWDVRTVVARDSSGGISTQSFSLSPPSAISWTTS
jgi:hypothetical protein